MHVGAKAVLALLTVIYRSSISSSGGAVGAITLDGYMGFLVFGHVL